MHSRCRPAATTVPAVPLGYDGGKQINGRKQRIVTDVLTLLLVVAVRAANVCGRAPTSAAASAALGHLPGLGRWRLHRPSSAGAVRNSSSSLEVVKHTDDMEGFVVLPIRWV